MPSFDIANKLDLQKIDNAINVANKKIVQRYDFRGTNTTVELNKKEKTLKVEVPDEMKLKAVQEIVNGCLYDQGVSHKSVEWGQPENASLGRLRIHSKFREGMDHLVAKDIVQRIKDLGLKVTAKIQDEQVRVEGKNIDDL
ncbi:MAG: DUF520 family protein, partial [bacterium]